MATMMRDGFANLMLPGLFQVVSDRFKEWPEEFSKIFEVKSSKKRYEYSLSVEGFGAANQKNEGSPVEFVNMTEGYKTTFTNLTFARGTRITREAYDDDLYSVFKSKLGMYLARAIKQRKEILAADILNNGFSTAGIDGQYLFSTAHPYKSGGTYSNTLGTQADLSATSLQDLITVVENTTDAGSVPISLMVKKLIVPVENKWAAKVILKSSQDPDSANNAINPLADEGIKMLMNHYLTDSDAWYLQCDNHGLLFFNRELPKMTADDDFDTGDAKVKIVMRCSAGYDDPRGMAASQGI